MVGNLARFEWWTLQGTVTVIKEYCQARPLSNRCVPSSALHTYFYLAGGQRVAVWYPDGQVCAFCLLPWRQAGPDSAARRGFMTDAETLSTHRLDKSKHRDALHAAQCELEEEAHLIGGTSVAEALKPQPPPSPPQPPAHA